ncbi:MAG: class I SAM-dependent methyltransferase, partial [Phycisphaerae bacterium]
MFVESARSGTAYRFQRRSRLVGELASSKTGTMLDCATGTGEVTLAALKTGMFSEAVINDISEQMLVRSQALIGESGIRCSCTFSAGDVFDLSHSAKTQSFDLILCIGLVAHSGRLQDLLALCRKLLRPGGQILLQTTVLDHLSIKIIRMLSESRHIRQKGYAIRHYKHEEVEHASNTVGLNIVDRRLFGLDVPFLDKLFPRLNFAIERQFESFAPNRGSEAIYV